MTPEQLKASILQYAIQGKLVEQRPEEGTGEELYRQIQAEKLRLIKEGTIKKEKALPEITEDEIPFDLPDSWKWVRIGQIFNLQAGKNITASDIYEEVSCEHRYLCYGGNGVRGYVSNFNREGHYTLIGRQGALCGNINVAEGQFYATEHAVVVDHFNQTDVVWSAWFLKALNLNQYATATAQPGLAVANIVKVLIPLPPLAEQIRIVAKIEELLPYVDRYAVAYEKLEQFNAKFPEDMKKSILQYAIQGKLVEQRPEEGTGEELYRQIQYEKQRLIKEGKIKKEKPLPEISEDEVPFEIPDSWRWCYVGDLFNHNTGKAMNSSAKKTDKPGAIRPFITTSNVYWNSFDFSVVKEMFFSDDEVERCTVTKGDILMCEGGAYFGRTAIWNYDYDICFQNHVHRLRPYQEIDLMFFYHIFFFYKNMNMMKAKGTAMPGLSSITLHQMIIPLPPLAEQKRIVAKLEEILPLCERLK